MPRYFNGMGQEVTDYVEGLENKADEVCCLEGKVETLTSENLKLKKRIKTLEAKP